MTIIDLEAYLYAKGGLMASIQPERLKRAFDVLTRLFNQVGLQTNTEKTVGMVCQSCNSPGGISEEAYKKQTARKGPTFWEGQRRMAECP